MHSADSPPQDHSTGPESSPELFAELPNEQSRLDAPSSTQQERLLQAAVAASRESIIITDAEAGEDGPGIVYVNPAFTALTGYKAEEVLRRSPRLLMGPKTDASVISHLRYSLQHNTAAQGEMIIYRKDGSEVLTQWHFVPIYDEAGQPTHWLVTFHDLTQQRQLERQVLEVQAREQRHLAQEIHDGLVQQLTGVSIFAQLLHRKMRGSDNSMTSEMGRLVEMIQETVRYARSLSHGMYPQEMAGGGLLDALQRLAVITEETQSVTTTLHYDEPLMVSDEQALHLYRIAQEAVGNAVRHATPSSILLKLVREGDLVVLTIEDDGSGIEEEMLRQGSAGLGLHSMRYRAQLIGAVLQIERIARGGTRVVCVVELP